MKNLILFVLIIIVFLFGLNALIEKYERSECIKWADEKIKYTNNNWDSPQWAKDQCKRYSIEL